jgi:hypothetical protein
MSPEHAELHQRNSDLNLLLLSIETLETQLKLEGDVGMATRVRAAIDRGWRKGRGA